MWRTGHDMLATALRSSSLMSCFLQTLNTTNWKVKMLFSPLKVCSAGFGLLTHTKVIHLSHHVWPTKSVCKDPAFCLMCLFSSYFDIYGRQRFWRKIVDCWVSFPGCRILSLCLGGSPTQSAGIRAVTISDYCKTIPNNDTAQSNILQYAGNSVVFFDNKNKLCQ